MLRTAGGGVRAGALPLAVRRIGTENAMTQTRLPEIFERPDYRSLIATARERRRLAEQNLEAAKAKLVAETEPDKLRYPGHRDTPAVTEARTAMAAAEQELIDARAAYETQCAGCEKNYVNETKIRLRRAMPILRKLSDELTEAATALSQWHAEAAHLRNTSLLVMDGVPKIRAGAEALQRIVDRADGSMDP